MEKYTPSNNLGPFAQMNSVPGRAMAGLWLLALLVLAGCQSPKVTDHVEPGSAKVPRPNTIWVYDFASTTDGVPTESVLTDQVNLETADQTPKQAAAEQKLGHDMAVQLIGEIQNTGLKAAAADASTQPQPNDIVIRGYLLSVEEGNAKKRVLVGFGVGAAELKVAVEGFRMTETGLHRIGSGKIELNGSKAPGSVVGVAGMAAMHTPAGLIVSGGMRLYGEESGRSKVEGQAKTIIQKFGEYLKKRFQQQGWID